MLQNPLFLAEIPSTRPPSSPVFIQKPSFIKPGKTIDVIAALNIFKQQGIKTSWKLRCNDIYPFFLNLIHLPNKILEFKAKIEKKNRFFFFTLKAFCGFFVKRGNAGKRMRKSACDSKNRIWLSFNHLHRVDLFSHRANDVSRKLTMQCDEKKLLNKALVWSARDCSFKQNWRASQTLSNHFLINPNCSAYARNR